MAAPVAAAAITAGAGVASGVGGALAQPDPIRAKLPPELEAQQLEILKQSITQFQQESQRSGDIADALQQRGQIFLNMDLGTIPDKQAMQLLTRQNQDIAAKYGDETLNLLGFEQQLRGKAEELLGKSFEDFKDPIVEREIERSKQVLQEQLTRDFGADWQQTTGGQRAWNAFIESSSVMRSQAANQERQQQLGTLGSLTSIGSQLGQGVFQGRGYATGELLSGINAQLGVNQAGAGLLGSSANIGAQSTELAKTPFGLLQQFGTQDLSKDIQGYIAGSGAGGMFPEFQTYKEAKNRGSVYNTEENPFYSKPNITKEQYYSNYSPYARS